MPVNRRTALGLLGLGVVSSRLEAAHQHLAALQASPQTYRLQFFTAQQHGVVDQVAEMILPADDHSPGAHEAKVGYYIDLVAANSSAAAKANWKSRLAAFEKVVAAQRGDHAAALRAVAAQENNPGTPAEHFFVDMKKATLFGYYTSQIGLLKELGYKGNEALASFPGCTHPAGTHR
jgi:gluconate 2-dehydrogenase subunit 3-like protein